MRSFPFGLAALSILVLSLLSGAYLLAHPTPKNTADLTFWVFAKPHHDAYVKALPAFLKEHPGVRVDIQLVNNNGLAQRLQAAFQADLDVPDMVEIEISSAGSFFRGPLENVGFWDITDRLRQDGLFEKMVRARFAPYTSRGRIFGLPHDVHPVMLAYNRELMEQAGVYPSQIETWDDFIAAARKVTVPGKRYMIEMSDSGRDQLEVCLFQRGGNYFNESGDVVFDNEAGVETMKWYVPLVASRSKTKIANNLSSSYGTVIAKGIQDGYFVSLIAPDWRTKGVENDIGPMSGKMALMPFPAVKKGGPRTSTWGGTMLGITKACRDKELAWALAKHLYLNERDLAERFADTNILPPVPDAWKQPAINAPRPYWSGQRLGREYADLAPQVPYQYTSPFVVTAKSKLDQALNDCVSFYNANGDAGFDAFVRARLKRSADEVRKQIARNPF
jgi:arabinosaccharide transport system substrate-binding protein